MDIFDLEWVSLLFTGLGTLFLLGEVLVNMRGIFGLLGIGFIAVYFGVYSDTGSTILMFIIFFAGLLLIIIDGKLLNDGTLATLGGASMIISVAVAAPDLASGSYAVLGVLIGGGSSFFFLKVFKRREMWTKITLKDQLTNEAGYNSINKEYEKLIGQEGITLNDLRPVGTIRVNNEDYSAISDGRWLEKGSKVRIVQVDGTKIQVKKINE